MTQAHTDCDLLVVGGGINGAGIARDAAGRGLRVVLCEQDDLAAHTSSSSTKLIHGGLRYLEHFEFSLVRKALAEREVLLAAAPHIMWPLRFVLPHEPHLRPAWMIRAGLFLYDHLARRMRLPSSTGVDLRHHPAGEALRASASRGFVYSDGWVDDARLVVLNAVDAAERGARIHTRMRCTRIIREHGAWSATLRAADGSSQTLRARSIVNAAGPWVGAFLDQSSPVRARHAVRLIKGSHIVVPRLFDHSYAYLFQNVDRRVVFAIPYETDFTLLGTTDVEFQGDATRAAIDPDEIKYLCELAGRYFQRTVTPADVVWSYSGVRPLLEDESADASSVTRDYSLELDSDGPPLLSVFGGKITTYRRLAEEVLSQLLPTLGISSRPWTAAAPLPGGDMPAGDFDGFLVSLLNRYPDIDPRLLHRWARTYGTRLMVWLGTAQTVAELGEEVLPGLRAAEIQYLRRVEWARTAQDILWRRTKLGLHLPPDSARTLTAWLEGHPST